MCSRIKIISLYFNEFQISRDVFSNRSLNMVKNIALNQKRDVTLKKQPVAFSKWGTFLSYPFFTMLSTLWWVSEERGKFTKLKKYATNLPIFVSLSDQIN